MKYLVAIAIIATVIIATVIVSSRQSLEPSVRLSFDPRDFPLAGSVGIDYGGITKENAKDFEDFYSNVEAKEEILAALTGTLLQASNIETTKGGTDNFIEVDLFVEKLNHFLFWKSQRELIIEVRIKERGTEEIFSGRYISILNESDANSGYLRNRLAEIFEHINPTLFGEVSHSCGYFASDIDIACLTYFSASLRGAQQTMECVQDPKKNAAATRELARLREEIQNFSWKNPENAKALLDTDESIECVQ